MRRTPLYKPRMSGVFPRGHGSRFESGGGIINPSVLRCLGGADLADPPFRRGAAPRFGRDTVGRQSGDPLGRRGIGLGRRLQRRVTGFRLDLRPPLVVCKVGRYPPAKRFKIPRAFHGICPGSNLRVPRNRERG
jgi:hypothetical protein